MSLPLSLTDSYKKYKKDTKTFTQWLASAATATGTVREIFETDATKAKKNAIPRAGGRLKGKARKQAKQQNEIDNVPATTTFPVAVKDFVELAQAIVNHRATQVPDSTVRVLRDIIKARKSCATWFADNQQDPGYETKTGNGRHQYFINVLEKVYAILDGSRTIRTKQESHKIHAIANIKNTFECLAVEKTEIEETTPIPATHLPTEAQQTSKKAQIVSYVMKTSEEEVVFAARCFFRDLTRIRGFVIHTWREYRDGEIGLESASLVMNAAISMMEIMNDDFLENFPQFKSHFELLNFMNKQPCGQTIGEGIDLDGLYDMNADGRRVQPATIFCQGMSNFIRKILIPHAEDAMSMTKDEMTFFTCVGALLNLHDRVLGQEIPDEMLRALELIFDDDTPLTWTIFAAQMFWDTRCILGDKLARGRDRLTEVGNAATEIWNGYFNLEDYDKIEESHKRNCDKFLQEAGLSVLAITNDWEPGNIQADEDPKQSLLMNNYPSFCDLFSHYMYSRLQNLGTNMGGTHAIIVAAAHLYNAAHKTKLLSPDVQWKDMDYLINRQEEGWMFVGKRPDTVAKFRRHYMLALGYSVGLLAKDFDPSKLQNNIVVGHVRHLFYMTRFYEANVQRKGAAEKVVSQTYPHRTAAWVHNVITCCIQHEKSQKTPENLQELSSFQGLLYFKKAMMQDEFPRYFNMMGLYLRCIALLRSILKHCMHHSPKDWDKKTWGNRNKLYNVVFPFFDELEGLPRYKPTFPGAVDLLKELIKQEGDVEYRKAEELATNRAFHTGNDKKGFDPEDTTPKDVKILKEVSNQYRNLWIHRVEDASMDIAFVNDGHDKILRFTIPASASDQVQKEMEHQGCKTYSGNLEGVLVNKDVVESKSKPHIKPQKIVEFNSLSLEFQNMYRSKFL
jgi:hypothetical protein